MIVMLHPADQRPQKQLRNFKAIDGAAFDRAMNFGVVRFAPEKLERLRTNRQNFPVVFVNRQNGRFVQNDALLGGENDCVDRAQVNRQIIREEAAEDIHNAGTPWFKISTITATDMPTKRGEQIPAIFQSGSRFRGQTDKCNYSISWIAARLSDGSSKTYVIACGKIRA